MTSKLKAKKLIGQFSLAILAELGYKISLEEVAALAKSSALIEVDELMKVLDQHLDAKQYQIMNYWEEVKQEIENL